VPVRQIYRTATEEETIALGEKLGAALSTPRVVLLVGNLGAGKTTLMKGIARAFGIVEDEVTSPTFTLVHEYSPKLYHIDLYRLDTAREVESLGLDDLFARDALVVIEWGERFPELMPSDRLEIHITILEDGREFELREPAPA
jgi:tRNA threonylcarbamoyladenosine biosynthesis protein TsaE